MTLKKINVDFDGMAAAAAVYERLRTRPIGSKMPPWSKLSRPVQVHFAFFADEIVVYFTGLMSESGIEAEATVLPPRQD